MSVSENSSDELYEVEKIIDVAGEGKNRTFLVKWKGFSNQDNTWEPEENLQECGDKIAKFFEERQASKIVASSKKERKEEEKKGSPKSKKVKTEQTRKPAGLRQITEDVKSVLSENKNYSEEKQNGSDVKRNGPEAKQYLAVKAVKVGDTDVTFLVDYVDKSKTGSEYVKLKDLADSKPKLIVDYFEILLRNKYSI